MTEALSVADVQVRRGETVVVHDVTFAVSEVSWFGVIGANGSGKTTLLRALAGRLPFAGGECAISGTDCARDRAYRASMIGFSPPIESLPDRLRVREALALVAGNIDEATRNIAHLGEAMGIPAMHERWIGDCSSGMRQRLAIALAFAGGQRIIILDEPFNWLDPVAAYDVKCILREMVGDGLTLVTALHDLPTLLSCCHEGLLMADGRAALPLPKERFTGAKKDPETFEHQMIQTLRAKPSAKP